MTARPIGRGYAAEEQITGEAHHGGLQIVVHPMKAEAYHAMHAHVLREGVVVMEHMTAEMGLAPGGRMEQEIYDDPHAFDVWNTRAGARCFVHIANSLAWRSVPGEEPPTTPLTAREYSDAGMPWFDYYGGDRTALDGAETLAGLNSVRGSSSAIRPLFPAISPARFSGLASPRLASAFCLARALALDCYASLRCSRPAGLPPAAEPNACRRWSCHHQTVHIEAPSRWRWARPHHTSHSRWTQVVSEILPALPPHARHTSEPFR
ncbi:hypothetical protein [Gaopeijia maritima]|uniref:Uncharacterized protein n=1 Tax=Gaopeijia maritima TaxID=3119007 RepID=A0ABU9ED90_9BACT